MIVLVGYPVITVFGLASWGKLAHSTSAERESPMAEVLGGAAAPGRNFSGGSPRQIYLGRAFLGASDQAAPTRFCVLASSAPFLAGVTAKEYL